MIASHHDFGGVGATFFWILIFFECKVSELTNFKMRAILERAKVLWRAEDLDFKMGTM